MTKSISCLTQITWWISCACYRPEQLQGSCSKKASWIQLKRGSQGRKAGPQVLWQGISGVILHVWLMHSPVREITAFVLQTWQKRRYITVWTCVQLIMHTSCFKLLYLKLSYVKALEKSKRKKKLVIHHLICLIHKISTSKRKTPDFGKKHYMFLVKQSSTWVLKLYTKRFFFFFPMFSTCFKIYTDEKFIKTHQLQGHRSSWNNTF